MNIFKSYRSTGSVIAMATLLVVSANLQAAIEGIEGNTFNLFARQAQISTPDGDSLRIWAFAETATGDSQYPGPTLIAQEGDTIKVTLSNVDIPQPVSMVFPGQENVTPECFAGGVSVPCANVAVDGLNVIQTTAAPGEYDAITYTFTAKPGTYMYHSGVNPQIQIEMGMVGALIVRPTNTTIPDNAAGLAYNDPGTAYDQEYLFFHSEMDPKLHYLAENNALSQWDNANYRSVLFFINGRNAPDTLAGNGVPQLHHQPYGSLVIMYPGERILLRVLNAGRYQHPLHLHGNHYDEIARDGNILTTTDGMGDEVFGPITDYTYSVVPGSTGDLMFTWTGKGMGWDIFNSESDHGPCDNTVDTVDNRTGIASGVQNPNTGVEDGGDGFHDVTWEWCADHGEPLPVAIPENQDLGFGGFYGGSPYLGDNGSLPVGEGGLNPWGGMIFMWHSHSERDLTNNDIFPGGMLTLMVVLKRP